MIDKVLLGIDIDGVFSLSTLDDIPNEINRTPIHYLNKILEAVPNCDVLITSSWGNIDNETVECFIEAGFKYPERVVGNVGVSFKKYPRTEEIIEWLEKYDKKDCYKYKVYLDDEIVMFDYFVEGASKCDVVECRPDKGLDIDKAYETICRLQGISLKFWS